MNPGKKIFFLCLALVLLIVMCVSLHLQELSKTNNLDNLNTSVIIKSESNDSSKLPEETHLKPSPIKEIEKEDSQEIKTQEEKDQEIQEDFTKEDNEQIESEPLITTDKRYKRTGNEKAIEQMSIESQLLQIKIRDYIAKYPITFQASSNKLTKNSLTTISTIVKFLKSYPNIKIEVAGHTDSAGSKKYNLNISISRAVAVKKQLIEYGFSENKVKARGYADEIPLVENDKNGYSKINRRVEFNIIEE